MKRRVVAVFLSLAMVAALATGCGNSGKEASSSADSSKKTESTSEDSTFIQPITSMPASLQPSTKSDDQVTKTRPVSDRLLAETADGIEYYLADSLEVSDDGKEYTLHLNEDANWSDGEPITVDDILFTIDYAGISSNGSSSANTIAGQPINFEKVDDKTLKIQLPQPYATYVRTLDQMCVLPSHAFDGDATKVNDSDYFKQPGFASSGAYVVSEINDDNIVFTARDDYYRGTPSVKKIIMKTIGSGSTSDIALENDEISYMRVTTTDQLEKYKKASDEYTLYELSEARLNYLQINPASNLTDDERKAIFLALDAQEIIDAAYGTDELAQPANSLMTPDQSFYDKDCKGYSQDIETAKKLAESSGLTGKTINYKFNSDRANMEAVATVVQQQLEKIGVKVNVQGADSTTFFKSFFYMWYGSGEKDTSWDLASNGWDSERGTDLGQSLSYFNSSFGYSDEIKTLAQQINATVDQDEAKTLAKDLQQKTLDEYYQYPLTYTNYIMVSKKNVTGLDTCKIIPEFNDYLKISVK